MTVFYFTATGNSLAVAKRIGGTLVSIPQVVDSGDLHYRDDVIGVVFPIYWWALPKMVRRFLDKARLEADYTFAVGTYGSLPGAAMLNLQKRASKNGGRFDYVNHLLMLDNYLPVFEMGAQAKKLPGKKVEEKTAEIASDIGSRKHRLATASPWLRAMSAMAAAARNPAGKNAKKYIVSGKCDRCGICAKVCPAGNIAVADGVCFADDCEACLACLHLCPRNALLHKCQKSDKRWINPEVSLGEIVSANNRGA